MTETTHTANNPNTVRDSELEHQAGLLLADILDNPQSIGASVEDESYSRLETENGVREKIDIGSGHVGLILHASRIREHDPERHLPGKFAETITIRTSIPDIAQLVLVMVDGKVWTLEYSDQDGKKGTDGLGDALEAIKLAVEELQTQTS